MDQFTEDELGLDMLANPNRMSSEPVSNMVNLNQPMFQQEENHEFSPKQNTDYFHHEDMDEPRNHQPNFFDDNVSDVSKVSVESTEDILKKKNFLLTKLKRLQQKGVELTKNVSINTPLHELENEYMMAKKEQSMESNLEWCKQGLVYVCSFLENTNRIMKTGAKLDGWSEEIYNTRDNYDDVFEELIDKYGGDIEMAPEIRLIMMLIGSALAVHMSNTMIKGGVNMQNFVNTFHEQKESGQHPQQQPVNQMAFQSSPMPTHTSPPPVMSGPDPRLVEELLNEDINSVVSASSSSSSSSSSHRGKRRKKNSVSINF